MRTTPSIVAISLLLAFGCEQSVDRGQSKRPPKPVEEKPAQNSFDTVPQGGSQSTLGKARDSAVHLRDKMQARDAEIGKMADDIFKTPEREPPPAPPAAAPGFVPAPPPR
ncbi:MAG: hypothetical protein EXS17_07490 [Phycisphaerales bacterium]|nr:hypothetical protein [Phycisphaerales bacterium]